MKAVVDKLNIFKNLISIFGSLVEDATFIFSPDGMTVTGMDISHCSMTQIQLSKDFFSEYVVKETVNVSIHLQNFILVLKTVSGGVIELTNKREELLTIRSKSKAGTVGEIHIKLMDIESDELTPDKIDYLITKEFNSSDFKQFVETVVAFGDEIHFEITNNYMSVMAEGDIGKKIETMELAGMEIDGLSSFKNKFSASYITRFLTATKVSKQVTLMLGEEKPLSMTYKFDGGFINFFLAPKIDDF